MSKQEAKIDIELFKRQLPGRMHTLEIMFHSLVQAIKDKSDLVKGLHSDFTFQSCHIIEILLKARIQLEGKTYTNGHSLISYYEQLSDERKAILNLLYKSELKKADYLDRLVKMGLTQSGNSNFKPFSWLEYKSVLDAIKKDNVNSRYSFETGVKLVNSPNLLRIATITTYRAVFAKSQNIQKDKQNHEL